MGLQEMTDSWNDDVGDDDNEPVWPTWAPSLGVRDVYVQNNVDSPSVVEARLMSINAGVGNENTPVQRVFSHEHSSFLRNMLLLRALVIIICSDICAPARRIK
jgi:hypothetical protein